jgi:hypothetical protein
MAMDSYYTDRFDKYANDEGIYHVLFACPRGTVIKEKHRILGLPPLSEHRRPCEVCVGEIKDWLASLPVVIRPSQFQAEAPAEVRAEVPDADPDEVEELRQEEVEYQDQGEIVLPE